MTEEVALDLPFGRLLHFAKDVDTPQPTRAGRRRRCRAISRRCCAAPSRRCCATTTSTSPTGTTPATCPLEAGAFGVEDYVDYLIRFLEAIGPGAHLLAVCQPCVQALAAVAVMSEDGNPATPRSMTLMAGPIDTRESPTQVNELATSKPLAWFERNADRPGAAAATRAAAGGSIPASCSSPPSWR